MTYQRWLADAAQALNQVNPTENGKVDALVLLQLSMKRKLMKM